MRPALVLVDVQHDFLTGIVEPHFEAFLYSIEKFLEFFRCRDLPVLHVRMETTLEPDNRMPHWIIEDRKDCLKGSPGADPPAGCAAVSGEPVFVKPFFSGFGNSEISRYLAEVQADTLVLAGVNTHVCIKQTALDAYSLGFRVRLAEGAVGSYEPLSAAMTEAYLSERGLSCVSLERLKAELEGGEAPQRKATERLPTALIQGREVVSNGEVWNHCAPTDESVLWACHEADNSTIDKAVRASKPWSGDISERREILSRFARLLGQHSERLAELLVRDLGKPWSHARGEMQASVSMVEAVLERFEDDLSQNDKRFRRRPLGTVALITPYNNPVMIPVGKFVPALAFGNSVVWKPSPSGWRVAVEVSRLLSHAGLPDGCLNLLFGGASAARALMEHPGTDAVTLSGGMRAGYVAKAICAANHLPLQAELGGNNAALAWGEVDWSEVAAQVVRGAFGFAGQRCTANRRLIVPEHRFEVALEALRAAMNDYPMGDPAEESVDCGPLVSAQQLDRVRKTLVLAERAGVQSFAKPLERSLGYYQSPTVLWGAKSSSHLVQEETFGPLLVLQKAQSFEQAMTLANGVRHGLVLSLFSHEENLQERFLDGAQAGILKLNQATHGAHPEVPFGGWKRTGLGPPEHGPGDVEFYTKYQAVYRV